jgi:hypothetical protein
MMASANLPNAVLLNIFTFVVIMSTAGTDTAVLSLRL